MTVKRSPMGPMEPHGVAASMKVAKAIDMRIHKHTWDEIATECGWSNRGTAYAAVRKELDKIKREPAEHLMMMELAAMDELQKSLWKQATTQSKGKRQTEAARQVLSIMARRAKLLGLDDFERRSMDLAERQHALDAAQSKLVFEIMNRVMNQLGLTAEQRALLPTVVPGELAKITAEADAEDEVVDE